MSRSTTSLAACLLAAGTLAAGCGSSNSSDTSGGGGGATPKVNQAVKQCLERARSVQPADARKTAIAACDAAKSGNVEKVKSAAKQECLNAVKQLPDSAMAQKDAAKKRCEAIK